MDDITQKKLLRPEEAAAIMSLGRSTIYLMLASGGAGVVFDRKTSADPE